MSTTSIWWRGLGVVLVGLSLVVAVAFNLPAHAATASANVKRDTIIKPSGMAPILKTATVDWSKLSRATAQQLTAQPKDAAQRADPLSPAQRAAYEQAVAQHKIKLPMAVGHPIPAHASATPLGPSPNFDSCGYKDTPCLSYSHAGLTSAQIGENLPQFADNTIASNPSYVLQGTDDGYIVYNFSGGVVSGPVTNKSFFSSIYKGYGLSGPQVFWDASRLHWIIVANEQIYDGSGYIDIAVSKAQNVTLNPATQYYLYQIPVSASIGIQETHCESLTLGSDYWGVWITCTTYNGGNVFLGNAVFGFGKNQLYAGTATAGVAYTQIPSGVSNGSGGYDPAMSLSAALEDGTPDAEFVVATDAGYFYGGGTSSNITTCAFTDTHRLVQSPVAAPSLSCVHDALPVAYAYPIQATIPGANSVIQPYFGAQQIMYKAGMIYLALTTATNVNSVNEDGVYWAEYEPQLTSLDPAHPQNQQVSNIIDVQANIWALSGADSYTGVYEGTSENDGVLLYTYSNATTDPSIAYTGRRATDASGLLGGQNGASVTVAVGTQTLVTNPGWGLYSACSLDTNLTSRGLAWCSAEYAGPDVSSGGWDTWIAGIRAE